jgi:hypothetical protein
MPNIDLRISNSARLSVWLREINFHSKLNPAVRPRLPNLGIIVIPKRSEKSTPYFLAAAYYGLI